MSEFGLSTIGQIGISVVELKRSVEFYRDRLNLKFLFEAPQGVAFFDCGGIRLLLGVSDAEKRESNSILYFKVDDIDAAAATLKSRGVEFESDPHLVARMPDHELWIAEMRDPDRNVVALMCEKRLSVVGPFEKPAESRDDSSPVIPSEVEESAFIHLPSVEKQIPR